MTTALTAGSALAPRIRPGRARWAAIPLGLVGGLAIGAIARGWMRLLTDDPEFTWSGTIFIVAAFGLVGLGHALAWTVRRADRRRAATTLARVVGAVLTLPMFTGAGALMLPTMVVGSIALWRPWRPRVRAALALLAGLPVVALVMGSVREGSLTLRTVAGLVLLIATYAVVLASLGAVVAPVHDGWRLPRWSRMLTLVAALLVGGVTVVSAVGVR